MSGREDRDLPLPCRGGLVQSWASVKLRSLSCGGPACAPMVPTSEDSPDIDGDEFHARPWFRASLVGVTLFAISGSQTPVLGNHGRGGEVIVRRIILAVPTSYVIPTCHVVPTSTYSTSSLVLPTSYVAPTVFPTSYVVPTVYSTSYVTDVLAVAHLLCRADLLSCPALGTPTACGATDLHRDELLLAHGELYSDDLLPDLDDLSHVAGLSHRQDYPVVASSATICDETTPARSAVASDSLPETTSRVPRADQVAVPHKRRRPVVESQPAPSAEERTGERTGSATSRRILPPRDRPPLRRPQTPPATRNTAAPPTTAPRHHAAGRTDTGAGPPPADSGPLVLPRTPFRGRLMRRCVASRGGPSDCPPPRLAQHPGGRWSPARGPG